MQRVLGTGIDLATLKHLAGDENLNMTQLALSLSDFVNGVAKHHAEISRSRAAGAGKTVMPEGP